MVSVVSPCINVPDSFVGFSEKYSQKNQVGDYTCVMREPKLVNTTWWQWWDTEKQRMASLQLQLLEPFNFESKIIGLSSDVASSNFTLDGDLRLVHNITLSIALCCVAASSASCSCKLLFTI